LCSLTLAVLLYRQFLERGPLFWDSLTHDRNAYYFHGLSLAHDFRGGEIYQFLYDLNTARVWPPLHGLWVGAVLAVGGMDYRLAVLPSLAGWVGTILIGYLLARRICPSGGNLAGLTAAVFIACSPAHRAFATDIMLESLGAFLSLLTLYFYLGAVHRPALAAYRALGLSLTALFLFKYNYWFLVVAALVLAEVGTPGRPYTAAFIAAVRARNLRRWCRRQLGQPINYLLVVSISLYAILPGCRGEDLVIGSATIPAGSRHNAAHVAYALVFYRTLLWWRRGGGAWIAQLGSAAIPLVHWHVLPIALWLLFPKRVGYFLWFLGIQNHGGHRHEFLAWLTFYSSKAVEDYHVGAWSALLAVALVIAGLRGRLRPGSGVVFVFVLLAAFLTVSHPNQSSRYLHSWIAALWIAAGAGLSALFVPRVGPRRWLAPLAAGALGAAQLVAVGLPAGVQAEAPPFPAISTRDLTDYYLDRLGDSHGAAFFATMDVKHLARWTALERFGDRNRLQVNLRDFGPREEKNRRLFAEWLASTRCDTIVFLEIPAGSRLYEKTRHGDELAAQVPALLAEQTKFRVSEQRCFPEHGCVIYLYRRVQE
jgi:hypothetical protein